MDTRATDQASLSTRQSLSTAPRTRAWVLSWFGEDLVGAIWEVDGGPGHTTSHLLGADYLVVTDHELVHVESLRRRFGHLENVEVLSSVDLMRSSETFDTIVVFDSLQRAVDPAELLLSLSKRLRGGGNVLIQVPADPALFGSTDEAAGHLRRFDERSLEQLIEEVGLSPIRMARINFLGALAWRLHNSLRFGSIGRSSARAFDQLTQLARLLDSIFPGRGLSLLAVARKSEVSKVS